MIALDLLNIQETDGKPLSQQSQKSNGDLFTQLLNNALEKNKNDKQETVASLLKTSNLESQKFLLDGQQNQKQTQIKHKLSQKDQNSLVPLTQSLQKTSTNQKQTQIKTENIQSHQKLSVQATKLFNQTKQDLEKITFEQLAPEIAFDQKKEVKSSFTPSAQNKLTIKVLALLKKELSDEDFKKIMDQYNQGDKTVVLKAIKAINLKKGDKDYFINQIFKEDIKSDKEIIKQIMAFKHDKDQKDQDDQTNIKQDIKQIMTFKYDKDQDNQINIKQDIKQIKDVLKKQLDQIFGSEDQEILKISEKEKIIQNILGIYKDKSKVLNKKEALLLKNQSQSLLQSLSSPTKEMAVLQKIFSTSKMSLSLIQELVGKKEGYNLKDIEKIAQASGLNIKKISFTQETQNNIIPSLLYENPKTPKKQLLNQSLNKSFEWNSLNDKRDSILQANQHITQIQDITQSGIKNKALIQELLAQQNEFIKQAINDKKKAIKDTKGADIKQKTIKKEPDALTQTSHKTEHTSYKKPISQATTIKEADDKALQAQLDNQELNQKSFNEQQVLKKHGQNTLLSNLLKTPSKMKIASSANMLDVLGEKIKKENKDKDIQAVLDNPNIKRDIIYKSVAAKETLKNFTSSLKEGLNNYKPPLSKLSLELTPEKLGSVEVTIKQRGSNLIVQIHSNPQALQLFMANAQDFKQQLFGAGFENVDLTFQDSAGNSFSSTDGEGGGEYHGQDQRDKQDGQDKEREVLASAEEMLLRQELQNEEIAQGKMWNSFGLKAYKNSMNLSRQLRLIELALTPRYA